MDQRSAKRPRSATPTKGDSPPKKKNKGTKKSKKSKPPKTSGNDVPSSKPTKSSLDDTATADGQMMAQMLSTFSKVEQSRFEAFQRSTFDTTAVQRWIATVICDRHYSELHYDPNLNGSSSSCNSNSIRARFPPRPLSDLVTPVGTQDEIGVVVAVAAKIYAQRLVAAAKNVMNESLRNASTTAASVGLQPTSTTAIATTQSTEAALQPCHVLQAWHDRRKQGLDPGFFLQPHDGLQWSCVFGKTAASSIAGPSVDSYGDHGYQQRRLAALATQEAFEKEYGITMEGDDNATEADANKADEKATHEKTDGADNA